MPAVTYNFTGLKDYWTYDRFSIANRKIGGGTGYINLAGSQWDIIPSDVPSDPDRPPAVIIQEDMNFMFSVTDMLLKFHSFNPGIHRFYNSTERNHTGTGANTDSLPRLIGLFGQHWISKYEHCIIHDNQQPNNPAIELDGTGARSTFTQFGGAFTAPAGENKKLTFNSSDESFDVVTPDYTTYHFEKCDQILDGLYYYRLTFKVSPNGVGVYIEWEDKDTGFDKGGPADITRYRIKQVSVSTDGGVKKIPFIKFRYTSWGYNEDHGVCEDAFHLVRSIQDFAGNEVRYEYDFDMDTDIRTTAARLVRVTYQDGCNQQYEYTDGWEIGSPGMDDLIITKITNTGGIEYEISYTDPYWRIDNSDTSTPDYHITGYAWNFDDTYTLPSGFCKAGSVYTAGGTYWTVRCVINDADNVDQPNFLNCLHGPGNVGNLMRRDVLKSTTGPTWLSTQIFNDDTDSETTNDNFPYLTAKPKYGTNADLIHRTEYGAANGYRLRTKMYTMYGTGANVGVKGAIQNPQVVEYTYTTNENTIAKIEYHYQYQTSPDYFFSETNFTYDANQNLIKAVTAINPDPSPGSERDEESLDLTIYYVYDGNGNLIQSTDARGNSSSFYYDQLGSMTRSVNQLGAVSIQKWDQTSTQLLSTTDPTGGTTNYSYSPIGQLISTRDAAGNVTRTAYDNVGNVTGTANANSHSGSMFYDQKGRLIKTISPSGVVKEMTLSNIGQLQMTKTTYYDDDYSGGSQAVYQRVFYLDNGFQVSSQTLPSDTDHGATESAWLTQNKRDVAYTYDDDGNTLTVTDRYGSVTTKTYDTLDRHETTLSPKIPDTTFGEYIRTTHKKIYNGPTGTLSEEQIQEETSSSGGTSWSISRAYYAIKTYTDDRAMRNIITQLPHHFLRDDDGNPHSYYAYHDRYYDQNGNVIKQQMRQVEYTTGSSKNEWPTDFAFDIANRLVKKSKQASTDTDKYDWLETTYEYDTAGCQTSVNRSGLVVQTTYDTIGRVTGVGKGSCGCGSGGGCGGGSQVAAPAHVNMKVKSDMQWQHYGYDNFGNRISYSDALGVFTSVTYNESNQPVATTDQAGRTTQVRYWPTGQKKQVIYADGNSEGYEYDIEGRLTEVWASVPEQNSAQAAGPFGGSKDFALVKTVEYYYGLKNDGTNGQNIIWAGTQVDAGDYVSGLRTYTYKGAGPVYYDVVNTSNAHGQPEQAHSIESDDSSTAVTKRYYNWRGKARRITHPNGDNNDSAWDDYLRLTEFKIDGSVEKNDYEYCLCGVVKRSKNTYEDSLNNSQTLTWTNTIDDAGRVNKIYHPYAIAKDGSDEYHSILFEYDKANRRQLYSDPTFGHTCPDTGGWSSGEEPYDEDNWDFVVPQRYLYGMQGGLEATGRVGGNTITAGQGEPYFVERAANGMISKVIYPDAEGGIYRNTSVIRTGQDFASILSTAATIYLAGVPTSDAEATLAWEMKIESGNANLYVDGSVAASQAVSINSAIVTHNGVTIKVVSVNNDDSWLWRYTKVLDRPQMEIRYEYNDDGSVKRVSGVDQSSTEWSSYGPEKYVVEYKYDKRGRVVKKAVRDNPVDDDTTRFEVDYIYDGRGQLTRERIWRYDNVTEMMVVTQDTEKTYDLAGNVLTEKFSDGEWAYTITNSYARGHQLTNYLISKAIGVTVTTSGDFQYDANSSLLTTKKLDIVRGSDQLIYRAEWTFTYDKAKRLKTYTNTDVTANERGNIWYDTENRAWQRWNDNSSTGAWASDITRYVYDGRGYAQEHNFKWEANGTYMYNYDQILTDYLRQPGGVRQKDISTVDQSVIDQFLLTDSGSISARIKRETLSKVERIELTASGTRQASGSVQDGTISKLGFRGGHTETFTGSSEFDPLVEFGGRHYLGGLGREINTHPNEFQSITYPMSDSSHIMVNSPPYSIDEVDVIDDPSIISGILNNGSKGGVLNPQDIVTPQFGISNEVGCNGNCVNDFVNLSVPVEGGGLNITETSNDFYQFNVISSGTSISTKPDSAVPIPLPPVTTGCWLEHCFSVTSDTMTYTCVHEACVQTGPAGCWCICTLTFEYSLYQVNNYGPPYVMGMWCIANRRLINRVCRNPGTPPQRPCLPMHNGCVPPSRACANLNTGGSWARSFFRNRCVGYCGCRKLTGPELPQDGCGCDDARRAALLDCDDLPLRVRLP